MHAAPQCGKCNKDIIIEMQHLLILINVLHLNFITNVIYIVWTRARIYIRETKLDYDRKVFNKIFFNIQLQWGKF